MRLCSAGNATTNPQKDRGSGQADAESRLREIVFARRPELFPSLCQQSLASGDELWQITFGFEFDF